jgi:putative transposase
MKKTRFSEEQMVKILREADKTPVSEVAKKHGVSASRSTPGASASGISRRWTLDGYGSLRPRTHVWGANSPIIA